MIATYFARPELGSHDVKAVACLQSHCACFMTYVHIWTNLSSRARLSIPILQHIIQRCKSRTSVLD